jgi:hypothetical protein
MNDDHHVTFDEEETKFRARVVAKSMIEYNAGKA